MTTLGVFLATLLLDVALAATAGNFSILSMNVAGLPQILNPNEGGNKLANSKVIGQRFAQYGYDVIHVQEDFNYHASIYQTDNHTYRTATSDGVPFGSGINTLSNLDWVDFSRTKWDKCSDASENDCWTPKGFSAMRVKVAASNTTTAFVDMYNLHADAGTEGGDEDARNANMDQLAQHISVWSVGNAVLVFGDTNNRYTRAGDTAVQKLLAQVNPAGIGLTDAWLELMRNGTVPTVEDGCDNPAKRDTCEVVDKVLYRSSPLLTLHAASFHYVTDQFLNPDNTTLTDHNPLNVNFTWQAGDKLQQSDYCGGPHGEWFTDVPQLANLTATTKPKTSVLTFRGAARLDSVGLTLADGTVFKHGGTGGSETSLTLDPDEFWTEATLCQADKDGHTRNFYIHAATSKGRTLEAGSKSGDCKTFTAPDGWQIVGYMGRNGDEMDQIAFVYGPQ